MPCSLTYANSTAINITNGALPGNFCHTTWQTTLDTFTSSLSASLTGNTSTFTFGPTTPTAENRDRPWLKVDTTTCKAVGWYFYNTVTSAWEPVLVQDVDNLLADTGVVAGTYPHATIGVNAKGRITSAVAGSAVEVSVLTGTVANQGIIPLPAGFTQAQCKWIVGVGQISSSHGDHNSSHDVSFTADANRVVTTTGIGVGSGTANYMIIGVK